VENIAGRDREEGKRSGRRIGGGKQARRLVMIALVALAACDTGPIPTTLRGNLIFSDGTTIRVLRLPGASPEPFFAEPMAGGYQLWPQPLPDGNVLIEIQATTGPASLLVCSSDGIVLERLPFAHLPAVSPNGERLAFILGGARIGIRPLKATDGEAEEQTRIVGEQVWGGLPPVWLDGNTLLFADGERRLIRADVETGHRRELGVTGLLPVQVFPDRREVLCTGTTGLVAVDPESGEVRQLGDAGIGRAIGEYAALSHDGRAAMFTRFRHLSLHETKDIFMMDLSSGKVHEVLPETSLIGGFWAGGHDE
jgi:hypothetical protein